MAKFQGFVKHISVVAAYLIKVIFNLTIECHLFRTHE